ncbi:MAG: M23 family metallopeptidase [Firmicutes bacterium]|nr:M23 family metallopeptidase [Bacillota bacterium]
MKGKRRWPQTGLRERLARRQEKRESYYDSFKRDDYREQLGSLPALLLNQLREKMFEKTVAAIIIVICLGIFSLLNFSVANRIVDTAYQLTHKHLKWADILEAAQPVMQVLQDLKWRSKNNEKTPVDNEPVFSVTEMAHPVNGTLISPFGKRPVEGSEELEMHYGIDVSAPAGSPVYAAFAGTVTLVDPNHPVFGETIYIRHADDTVTIYGRVTDSRVKAGDQVAKGEEIAKLAAGEGGQSHLHFEVWQEKQPVNPEDFLH